MPWVAKYVAKHILQMQPIAAFVIAASRIHYLATCSSLSVTSSSGEKKRGKTIRGYSCVGKKKTSTQTYLAARLAETPCSQASVCYGCYRQTSNIAVCSQ